MSEQIKNAVNRFLGWRLPDDFAPDCYITFDRERADPRPGWWPVGTNLLTADQARAMFEYCLTPPAAQPAPDAVPMGFLGRDDWTVPIPPPTAEPHIVETACQRNTVDGKHDWEPRTPQHLQCRWCHAICPVDKSPKSQGSPVDKTEIPHGEPRDSASYATEYAPTPAPDDLVAELRATHCSNDGLHDEAAAEIVALRERVAELERQISNASQVIYDGNQRESTLRAEWHRECADADNILFASGLPEPQWRTDGGSLQVPRIVAHFKDVIERAERAEAEVERLTQEHPCAELLWQVYEAIYGHRSAESIDPWTTAVKGVRAVVKHRVELRADNAKLRACVAAADAMRDCIPVDGVMRSWPEAAACARAFEAARAALGDKP